MRKKWGPLIGGILIGFIIMAMRYENVVPADKLIYKDNLVYESVQDKDKLFTGTAKVYFKNSQQVKISSEYKKGKLHGKTIEYDEEGSVLKKSKYKKGEIVK